MASGRLVFALSSEARREVAKHANWARCEVRARVGVNSGPVTRDRKREESRASTVSISKCGAFKYVTEAEKTPIGCVTGSKVWVAVSSGSALGDNGSPKSSCSKSD